MKTFLFVLLLATAGTASAACRWQWVDHDYNASTPAIQKQLCDSTIDLPAIRQPSIRPIQQPQIRPIENADDPADWHPQLSHAKRV